MKKYTLIAALICVSAIISAQTSRRTNTTTTNNRTSVNSTRNSNPATTTTRTSTTANRTSTTRSTSTNNNYNRTSSRPNNGTSTNTTTYTRSTKPSNTYAHNSGNSNSVRTTTRYSTPSGTVRTSTTNHHGNNHTTYNRNSVSNNHHSTKVVRSHNNHSYTVTHYVRPTCSYSTHAHHHSIDYRRTHHAYRAPAHMHITWTPALHNRYCTLYPEIKHWNYSYGSSIYTISAYDTYYNIGEVRRVYGKVSEVFYARETDEYFLYIGGSFPYNDFTVIIPGNVARAETRNPNWYYTGEHVMVTGLITSFNDKPEMVIKRTNQISVY